MSHNKDNTIYFLFFYFVLALPNDCYYYYINVSETFYTTPIKCVIFHVLVKPLVYRLIIILGGTIPH